MCADWNRQTWPYSTDTMPKQPRTIKAPPEEPSSFFPGDFTDQKHYSTGDGYPTSDSDLHHGTIDPSQMPYGSGLRHVPEHPSLGVGPPQHHQHPPLQPMPHPPPHQTPHTLQPHPAGPASSQTQNSAPTAPQAPQAPAPKTPTQPNPKKRQRTSGSSKAAANASGGTAEAGPSASPPKRSRTNTAWTQEEEQRLKQMRDAGATWSEIAKSFPSRTEGSVKKHWYKDMHWAEFGEEESALLLAAIKEYDANKWKFIGQKLGKPAKACEAYAKEHFAGKL